MTATTSAKPEMVLLHGWGMNRAVWEPLLPHLASRFHVTCLSLPGHGGAPWRPGLDTLASWAEQVLAAAPRRALWVGWSLGGLVAQQAALLAPQRVRAFVGIATTPCFVQRPGWTCAMAPAVLRQFGEALASEPRATLHRFLALQFHGVSGGRKLLRGLQAALAQQPEAHPDALRTGLALLQQSDLRASLGRLPPRQRWILGGKDRLVPPSLADALPPPAQVSLLSAAGHAPFVSHPAEVAAQLQQEEAE